MVAVAWLGWVGWLGWLGWLGWFDWLGWVGWLGWIWWFGWFGLLGWFGWFGWLPGAFGTRSLAKLAAARWDGHVVVYGQRLADWAPSAQDRRRSSRQHGGTGNG